MNRTAKNLILNAIYQFFLIAIPVITIPYVSRVLGPELLGNYSYVTSIITFLSAFVLMGLNQLGVREISKVNSSGEKSDLMDLFFSLWKMQFYTGIITVPVFFILLKIMGESFTIALLFLPMLVSYILDISWFFWGIEQIRSVVLRNLFIKMITLILTIFFVNSVEDYHLYIIINCGGQLLSNLIFWENISRFFNTKMINCSKLRKAKMPFIHVSLILLIPQIAIQVYSSLDKTIVGGLVTRTELSYYDQAQKIPRIINAIVSSMSLILMPKMVKLKDNERDTLMKISMDLTLFLSLLFCGGIIVVSNEFIPLFFGNQFDGMKINLILSSFLIPFISYGGVFSNQFTLSQGQYRKYTFPFVIGAILSPTLLYLLVPKYGVIAASSILIFTEGVICFLRIYVTKNYLSFSYLFKYEWTFLFSFFISVTLTQALIVLENISLIKLLVIKGIFFVLVYLLGCCIFNKKIRAYIMKKIKKC